jgi:endonuclease/exonuclease/phosphatase family metal-dependent hydrolase
MKLVSFNANYFLGFDGSLRDYLRHAPRGVRANRAAEQAAIDRFTALVDTHEPDVIALLEVDSGSWRTRTDGQPRLITDRCNANGHDYTVRTDNKYGDSLLARLPILHGMSNSVLWTGDGRVTRHRLSPGTKRLVHELQLPAGLSIFIVHLPLLRHHRKQHLQRLADLVRDREQVVICGDFNNYYGVRELRQLMDAAGLELHQPGETLPNAVLPYRSVDLVLASPSVDISGCTTLETDISDHLPVMTTIGG